MNRVNEEQKVNGDREVNKYLISAEPVPTPVIVHYNLPTISDPHGLYQHYCPPIEYQKAASPCPWPTAGMANKITQNPATHPESFRSLQAGEKRKISDIDRKKGLTEETRMPHRLIEKKRRDRINSSISSLKDLLPADMRTQTSRPLEKAVVLEMTIKYVRSLQRALQIKNEIDLHDIATSDRFDEGYKTAVSKLGNYPGIDGKIVQYMEQGQKSVYVKTEPIEQPISLRNISTDGEKSEDSSSHSSGYDSCDAKQHDESRSSESPTIDVVGTDSDILQPPYPKMHSADSLCPASAFQAYSLFVHAKE